MFQNKMKKLTATLLLFFMVFSIMPVQVFAEEGITSGSGVTWVPNEEHDHDHGDGTEGDNKDGELTDEEKAAAGCLGQKPEKRPACSASYGDLQ